MVGILIVTQGGLAGELLTMAKTISGTLDGFEALSIGWDDSAEEGRSKVGAALRRIDHGEGILILTDMCGSTPWNLANAFQDPGHVEIVAGVNLPMVVRLGCLVNQSMTLPEMAQWICSKGRSSITCGAERPGRRVERCEDF